MKAIKYFIILLFAGTFTVNAQNQVVNGGFESWSKKQGLPVAWRSPFPDKDKIFKESKDAHSGKLALEIVFAPQKEQDNRRIYTNPVKLKAGKYKIVLNIKGEGEIRYISLTKDKEKTGSRPTKVNKIATPAIGKVDTKEWTEYTLDVNIGVEDLYNLHICVNSAGGEQSSSLLIDDVNLVIEE